MIKNCSWISFFPLHHEQIPVPLLPYSSSSSPYQLKSSVVKATPTLSLCDVASLHSFSYRLTSFFIFYLSEHLLSFFLEMSPECFTMATVALVCALITCVCPCEWVIVALYNALWISSKVVAALFDCFTWLVPRQTSSVQPWYDGGPPRQFSPNTVGAQVTLALASWRSTSSA